MNVILDEDKTPHLLAIVQAACKQERERCAQIALTVGLGEPHSLPPYSVRELIAREILKGNQE